MSALGHGVEPAAPRRPRRRITSAAVGASCLLAAAAVVASAAAGPAAGVGCSLALAGDFVLAGKSAYFLQAFVNIGLVPDGGSTWLLARSIGRARATRMMMLGEKIGASQAEHWGLIYKAVDDEALIGEARALAEKLANGPTLAYATMKKNIATAMDGTITEVLLAVTLKLEMVQGF